MKKATSILIIAFIAFGTFAQPRAGKNPSRPARPTQPRPENTTTAELKVLKQDVFTSKSGEKLNYLKYIPETATATEKLPLIIYLHGGSGKGENPVSLVGNDGFPKYVNEEKLGKINAYILFPQLSSNYRAWEQVLPVLKEFILTAERDLNVDAKKVSLVGHSMGGTGTWKTALSMSELFSKIAPMSELFSKIAPMSGNIDATAENISKLKNLKIRAFVGDNDKIVPPESSVKFIEAFKKKGGDGEITVFKNCDHFNVPNKAFFTEGVDLIKWLVE